MDEADCGDGGVCDGGGRVRVVPEVVDTVVSPVTAGEVFSVGGAVEFDWVHPYTLAPLGVVVPTPTDPEPDRDQGADDGADRDELRATLLRRLDAYRDGRRVRVGDGDGGGHADPADVLDARTVRDVPLRTGADEYAAPNATGNDDPYVTDLCALEVSW
jgi:hypothetical protein